MNRIFALGAVLLAVGLTVHAQTYTPLYDFSISPIREIRAIQGWRTVRFSKLVVVTL
jgi:hypothetical protein